MTKSFIQAQHKSYAYRQTIMAITFIKNKEALDFRVSINLKELHHLGHKITNADGPVLKRISLSVIQIQEKQTTGLEKQCS